MKRSTYSAIVLIGLFALSYVGGLSSPAFANGVSDVLTVFGPDGTIFAQRSVTDDAEVPNAAYIINVPNIVDLSQYLYPTYLLESPDGPVSDVIGFGTGSTGSFLLFVGDSESIPENIIPILPNSHVFLESQQTIWDVTYLLDPNLRDQGYTATFFSDGEVPVPEPTTMLLLGSGLIGLLGYGRKRFRK